MYAYIKRLKEYRAIFGQNLTYFGLSRESDICLKSLEYK